MTIRAGQNNSIPPTAWGYKMQKISDIVTSCDFLAQRDNKDSQNDLDPLTVLVVNRLFNFFEANCPGYDKQYLGRDQKLATQKINFARGFMEKGINKIEQIELAIKKCRHRKTVNTPAVAEFLEWCSPTAEDLGLWTKEEAYIKAFQVIRKEDVAMSDAQAAIINHAISQTDSYTMKTKSEADTRPRFERNYEVSVRDFLSGKLRPIPLGLEDKSQETIELSKQEQIKKNFARLKGYGDCMPEIRRILGMNPNGNINP
jgi:hypothetical protein